MSGSIGEPVCTRGPRDRKHYFPSVSPPELALIRAAHAVHGGVQGELLALLARRYLARAAPDKLRALEAQHGKRIGLTPNRARSRQSSG